MVPIWEKYMLTVDEAVQYFGIGEKKIRMLISENTDTDYCFTVQVGNKSLINRHKNFLIKPLPCRNEKYKTLSL
nr:MAG TPA: excisionase [Caudoviricetes sp.]